MSIIPDTTGPLNAGGIAWYAGVNADTSPTRWTDLYGAHNATLVGTPTGASGFHATTRTNGYDAEYDWANGLYFETGISIDIYTLAFWFKASAVGQLNGLISQAADDASGFQVRQNGSNGTLDVRIGGVDNALAAFPFDGTWRHIALVRDTLHSQTLVYKNGALLTTLTGAWVTSSTLAIGTRADRLASFTGALDDIRVWGRALGAAEVALVFNPPPPTTTAKPRAWLPPPASRRPKARPWSR
jgi:hypothetical protein